MNVEMRNGKNITPVGFLGLLVSITEVPRASSSATLSAWMWYLSSADRGDGIATN